MDPKELKNQLVAQAEKYGMCSNTKSGANVVVRENLETKEDNVPFFGFILEGEPTSGPYKDLSLVFFPTKNEDEYIMTIVVGSEGYNQDGYLSMHPGTRRRFLELLPSDPKYAPFSKTDFSDLENPVIFDDIITNSGVNLDKYNKKNKVILIGCLVNSDSDRDLINAWIAEYANMRGWPTNNTQRDAANKAISKKAKTIDYKNQKAEVINLLRQKQFIVLQGAPGTGKTYLAQEIGNDENEFKKTYLIQFHAETSYSDFIEGIRPNLSAGVLLYQREEGKLLEAIRYALNHANEDVLLIIDEINRANLANVLGPVFFLFEKREDNKGEGIKFDDLIINKIPENLYVIATMNTADRSIAVVDFALRRRFAWYTVYPHYFDGTSTLGIELFNKIADIFNRHATDEELNLQPGGSYFKADTDDKLLIKIEYELMPLIKEYLDEGLLSSAKAEFSDFFYTRIKKQLYR